MRAASGEAAAKRARALLDTARGSPTAAVHADGLLEEASDELWEFSHGRDVAPPIGMSTTFRCAEDGRGHQYSRDTDPTRSRCEATIAAIEGTPGAPVESVLYRTGLSAIFALLARYGPGRVAICGGYHGTHEVLHQLQRISGGTKYSTVELPPPSEVKQHLSAGDVLWLETPRNPTCTVTDIAGYVEAARGTGIKVVVDGTFAPPPLQRPLSLGADAVMHSTTKYFSGHSDALGGVVCTADGTLAHDLRHDRAALGSVPGSLETWLLLRSLRTMHLRVERQSRTATDLAQWLHSATPGAEGEAEHPLRGCIVAVHHPSLPSHPLHDAAVRQMPGGFGGVFAMELSTEAAAKALPEVLHLFKSATSLGGVESLIEWRRKYDSAISPLLLRVSIGLEDFEHLRADLQRGILELLKP